MRTRFRPALTLALALALIAGACSGGGDEAAAPITPIPAAASPSTGLSDGATSPAAATTTTTTADDGSDVEAESDVRLLIVSYFQAAAARSWDTVYEASSVAFADACTPEAYSELTASVTSDAVDIVFVGPLEISVVGDYATGRVDISDGTGVLPIEGLLAVVESGEWKMAINPCDVATKVAGGDFSYPMIVTTTTAPPS